MERELFREARERSQILVHAADDHGIDLHRIEASIECRMDARKCIVQVSTAGECAISGGVERIERDVHARKPCCLQLACEAWQENTIGGDRHIFDALDILASADQVLRSFTHERLAAREAQVLDAATCSHFHHTHDLFEGEDLIMFAGFNACFGHAVYAAQITPVGERDAQVIYVASKAIFHRTSRVFRLPFAQGD